MAPVHSREVGCPAALHSSGSNCNQDADNSQFLLTAALHRQQAESNRRQPELEVMEIEDLVDRILLRLPPDDPGALTRASLVCKSWFNLLSDQGFRRRYRILHNTPPMLGFLHTWVVNAPTWCDVTRFVPTAGFCPRNPFPDSFVLDCRHGRVLLGYLDECEEFADQPVVLAVWDPMTESCTELREPNEYWWEFSASVVCAVPGCSHDGCGSGPFLVVFVGFGPNSADAYIYSSETREWSSAASLDYGDADDFDTISHVFVGGKLNFLFAKDGVLNILSYDLAQHCLTMIDMPSVDFPSHSSLLMKMEDGALGLAYLDKLSLHMWSRGAAAWTQTRVIDLKMMALPGVKEISPMLVGAVEGVGIIFVITSLGTYTINLRSLTSRMVSRKPYICEGQRLLRFLYPYMSFSNPQGADKLQKEALENHSYDAGSSCQAMVGTSGSMVGISGSATTSEADVIVLSDSDDD